MSDGPLLKLYQICGQIPEETREHLRIRLDGMEFTYGTDDYVRHQNAVIQECEMKYREEDRSNFLEATTRVPRAKEEKEDEGEPYKAEKPRYNHIGL